MTKSRPQRLKQDVVKELSEITKECRQLRNDFIQIKKRAKTLIKMAHAGTDERAVSSIRKKMGL